LIRADERLKWISVVVLTTSTAEEGIALAHGSHANCYITKPVELDQLQNAVPLIGSLWLQLIKLPAR